MEVRAGQVPASPPSWACRWPSLPVSPHGHPSAGTCALLSSHKNTSQIGSGSTLETSFCPHPLFKDSSANAGVLGVRTSLWDSGGHHAAWCSPFMTSGLLATDSLCGFGRFLDTCCFRIGTLLSAQKGQNVLGTRMVVALWRLCCRSSSPRRVKSLRFTHTLRRRHSGGLPSFPRANTVGSWYCPVGPHRRC